MHVEITVESAIVESPRVAQLRGLFDLPTSQTSLAKITGVYPLQSPEPHGKPIFPGSIDKIEIARLRAGPDIHLNKTPRIKGCIVSNL